MNRKVLIQIAVFLTLWFVGLNVLDFIEIMIFGTYNFVFSILNFIILYWAINVELPKHVRIY